MVDNASGDDTLQVIARELPGARVLANRHNLGYAAGQVQAAAATRAPALLFLNDDLEVPAGALRALLGELTDHPEAAAIGPALVGTDGALQRSAGPLPTAGVAAHRLRWLRWTGLFKRAQAAFRRAPLPPAGPVDCLMGAAILVRRSALERATWDPGYPFGLEDADLCARLARVGPLRYAPAVRLIHVGGVASARNPLGVVRGYELGWARYVARHDPRRWVAPLLVLGTLLDLPLRAALLGLRGLGLLLRGRAGDARAALGQAAATLWFALTGWPALLAAGWSRRAP